MIVEIELNWTFESTPSTPFPVTIYWRNVGDTVYNTLNLYDGSAGTATVTTISTSTDGIDEGCTLDYEGYIIPDCFKGTLVDCDPDICGDSKRVYWTSTADATSVQNCRGVVATCEDGGVIGLGIDPVTLAAQSYTLAPTINITGGDGTGLDIDVIYNSGTSKVTGFVINDPGSGYTVAPTVEISASNASVVLELDVIIGCGSFDYGSCGGGDNYSGYAQVGEHVQICVIAAESIPFTPSSVADIGTWSFDEAGCCSATGSTKQEITFNTPSLALYPTVYSYYSMLGTPTNSISLNLADGVPVQVCGIVNSFTPSPVPFPDTTDDFTNVWLFYTYVSFTEIDTPC